MGWIAAVIITTILLFIIGGIAYMVWERREAHRLQQPEPETPPDGGP